MSNLSDFKFGPHLRPMVDTCLWLLNNGDGQQEQFILNTLAPKLTPDLFAQIKGVFSKSLEDAVAVQEPPTKRLKISQARTPEEQAIESAYRNGVDLIERQMDVVCGCKTSLDESAKLRRAEARALDRVFFSRVGFGLLRERTAHFEGVCAFLDIGDLFRVACITPEMHLSVSQLPPRIWKRVADSFALPREIYWKAYSKATVKENFLHLRDIREAFVACCRNQEAAARLRDDAQIKELPAILTTNAPNDPRRVFREGILPVITAIVRRDQNDTTTPPAFFAKRCMKALMHVGPADPRMLGQPFFMYEAFFAAGVVGDEFTLARLIKHLNTQLIKCVGEVYASSPEDGKTGLRIMGAIAGRAMALVEQYGIVPKRINTLLCFPYLVQWYFRPLFERLIKERGLICTEISLFALILNGGASLLEPLITQGGAKVYSDEIPDLIGCLACKDTLLDTGAQVLTAIELLIKHAANPEDRAGPAEEMLSPTDPSDVFLVMAKYRDDKLMEKLIQLGYRPDKSNTQRNTLYRALTEKPDSDPKTQVYSPWPTFWDAIPTLVKYGATIKPEVAQELVFAIFAKGDLEQSLYHALLKLAGF